MKTNRLTPYHFFLKFAGWGYDPAKESKAAGRARCAKALAEAERQAKEAGVTFDWSRDDQTNRSFTDEGPEYLLWQCFAMLGEKVLGSLGGVDFGETGEPWGDTYARVVEAEIASEIDFEAVYGEDKAGDALPPGSVVFPFELVLSVAQVVSLASDGEDAKEIAEAVWPKLEPYFGAAVRSKNAGSAGVLPGFALGARVHEMALGAACQASNEATKHLRVDLGELLKRCLGFIEGFEDDDTQGEGDENVVPGLLADLRALTDGSPPAAYVDAQAGGDAVLVAVLNPKGEAVSVDVLPPGEVSCDFLSPGPDWKRVDVPLSLALAAPDLRDSLVNLRKELWAANLKLDVRKHFSLLNAEACAGKVLHTLKGGSVA